jgi:cytochrome P450
MSFDALSAIFLGVRGDDAMFATYQALILGFLNRDLEKGLAARDRMLAWYGDILAAKRAHPTDAPRDVIGILARAGELSDREIIAEIQHLFIGSGGVRFAWCNMLAFLAEHPAVQQRAREEVRKLGVPPSLSQLDESIYLQTMVEEVLRLSPILGLQIGRVAKAFEINGYLLPEGTLLVAGLYATSHDPSFFPDPDTFDPERPQKKARASGASEAGCPFSLSARFSYLPFGGGDKSTGHRCLGEQVVYLAMKLLLARIARDHRWTVVNMAEVKKAPSPYQAREMWIRLTADE